MLEEYSNGYRSDYTRDLGFPRFSGHTTQARYVEEDDMGTTRRRFPEERKREAVRLAAQPRMTISGVDLLAEHYPTWREARAELNELPLSSELWRE